MQPTVGGLLLHPLPGCAPSSTSPGVLLLRSPALTAGMCAVHVGAMARSSEVLAVSDGSCKRERPAG